MALCWEESIEMARMWRSGPLIFAVPQALERGIEHCEKLGGVVASQVRQERYHVQISRTFLGTYFVQGPANYG